MLTGTFVRVIVIAEQMFGVLIMMMMNQGSYRSIYGNNKTTKNHTYMETAASWLKSNAIKLVVCVSLAVLLFTSFMMMGTNASGGDELAEGEVYVTAGSGDTLWSIASRHAEKGDDIGFLVYVMKSRNNLEDVMIRPGQQLIIPNL